MRIGVPKEIKKDERRIALTPDKVDFLIRHGHDVAVEAGASNGANYSDDDYKAVGASIVSGPRPIWDDSDMVVKVKEPRPEEYEYLHEGLVLFTYLHLAAEPELTSVLASSKVTGIAYETVQEPDGSLPLLYPMSEIAGKLSAMTAGSLLQSHRGGPGKLLSRVPGIDPCRVVIVGGGTVGLNAALVARGIGGEVTIADVNLERLRYIDALTGSNIRTVYSSPANLSDLLSRADVAIGAVLNPGASAPKVVTSAMIDRMADRSIIIDVAIDQGGSVEGIRLTTHSDPTYSVNGVIHYAVPNIPGIVPNTSSQSLSNATLPYVVKIANNDVKDLVRNNGAIALGVNTMGGHVTYQAVAESLDMEYVPLSSALDA